MSIYFHSFRIGELYDAIGSHDAKILKKLETGLLVRDPELLVCTKAIVADGLLYHDLFSDDIYNAAITHIVQLLPSHRNFFEEKDYQTDYHTSWLELPKSSLWGYILRMGATCSTIRSRRARRSATDSSRRRNSRNFCSSSSEKTNGSLGTSSSTRSTRSA